jgi:3-methylcrotonyl-CoA carboxylase alpha subunit
MAELTGGRGNPEADPTDPDAPMTRSDIDQPAAAATATRAIPPETATNQRPTNQGPAAATFGEDLVGDPLADLVAAESMAAEPDAGRPAADSSASESDPRAVRVDVRSAMGIEAGPWTIGPDDRRLSTVRWLGHGRAALPSPEADDATVVPVLVEVGSSDPTVRSSRRSGAQRREVVVGGWRILVDVEPERTAALRERARRGRDDAAHSGPLEVRAIIPGRVVAVSVAVGDTVEAGQQLLVIEAMKMQNELRAPRGGTVERIAAGVGDAVDLGSVLLVLR